MDARRMLTLLALLLGLALLAGCAPAGWPREAAAAPTPVEPTAEPTGEGPPYPPPTRPPATAAPTDAARGYPLAPTPRHSPTPNAPPTPVVTPTEIPFPTPIPTPVVTPWPTTAPPLIPEAAGRAPEVFRLVYRAGDTVRAVQSDGTGDRLLVDPYAATGWHLAGDGVLVNPWQQGGPSPDGRTLALALSDVQRREDLPRGESPALRIDLFDLETGKSRVLVEDAVEPVWSPDGERLAYRDVATGGLWLVDVATGEVREVYAIVPEPGWDRHVTMMDWSPDGRSIVFVDTVLDEFHRLMVALADGTGAATAVAPWEYSPYLYCPDWSPRGDRIAFVYGIGDLGGLWVVSPDGADLLELTRDLDVMRPRWSPDGGWIAFSARAPYEHPQARWDLWLLDANGDEPLRLTAGEHDDSLVQLWSPDGQQLAFTGSDSAAKDRGVYVLSLASGHVGQMTAATLAIDALRSAR